MAKKILLVEDDKELAAITADMLCAYDYSVKIVGSCDEAYEAMTKEQYALMILDINLPDGTGFEVCRELRAASRIPVIFASA